MTFEMIDRDQRLVRSQRQSLADQQADQPAPEQAGTGCCGDRVDLANGDIRLVKHLADQAGQYFDMRTGRDFRDHPTKWAMSVVLADDRLGEDLPVASDQCRGAVVARGFKGKDQCHCSQPLPESPALR